LKHHIDEQKVNGIASSVGVIERQSA